LTPDAGPRCRMPGRYETDRPTVQRHEYTTVRVNIDVSREGDFSSTSPKK
jgi:hypothetical protein